MSEDLAFVLFPYLRTSKPVELCGFTLRSTMSVEHLTEPAATALEDLRALFFLDNHQQINEMVYAPVVLSEPDLSVRLEKSQALIAYVYGGLSPNGEPFFSSDHATFFIALLNARASEFSVTCNHLTTNLWPSESWPTFDQFHSAPGFSLYRNGRDWTSTFKGGRVYPAAARMWLNYSQDLYYEVSTLRQRDENWALALFFETESGVDQAFEERILNSLRWYRRSTRIASDEEDSLLHLAVALECLLNLEPGEKITARFVETVTTLLGSTDRLEKWANQFYEARSKIVHRGSWSHLSFYPDGPPQDRKSAEMSTKPHRSLKEWGFRIFRMCFVTILSGAYLAQRSKLKSAFIPNTERLISMKKRIVEEQRDGAIALSDLAQDVFDLDSYYYFCKQEVNVGLILEVARGMCQAFLNDALTANESVDELIRSFSSSKGDMVERYEQVQSLGEAMGKWRSEKYNYTITGESGQLAQMKEDPALVLAAMIEFVCHSEIKLQVDVLARSPKAGGA